MLILSVGVVGALVVSLVVLHHVWGARFEGTVTQITLSTEQCLDLLQQLPYGFGPEHAQKTCQDASTGAWFRAEVRNVGHRTAFLKDCSIRGLDRSGHERFGFDLSVGPLGGPAGPAIDPGQTVRWNWYTLTPIEPVDRYQVTCFPIDYGGNVPV